MNPHGAFAYCHIFGCVAYIGYLEFLPLACGEFKVAVKVGHCAFAGSLYHYGGADERFTIVIYYRSFDHSGALQVFWHLALGE